MKPPVGREVQAWTIQSQFEGDSLKYKDLSHFGSSKVKSVLSLQNEGWTVMVYSVGELCPSEAFRLGDDVQSRPPCKNEQDGLCTYCRSESLKLM